MSSGEYTIAHLFLPSGILDYFIITKVVRARARENIHIYLEELNNKPDEYSRISLYSKGFFEEIKVQEALIPALLYS